MKPCSCGMNQTTCVNGTGTCMAEPIIKEEIMLVIDGEQIIINEESTLNEKEIGVLKILRLCSNEIEILNILGNALLYFVSTAIKCGLPKEKAHAAFLKMAKDFE